MRQHRSFAVRFAYANFVINSIFTVIWAVPVMALILADPEIASSVSFVSFLSVWALLATHAGAAIAAYAAIHSAEDNEAHKREARRSRPDDPAEIGRTTSDGTW